MSPHNILTYNEYIEMFKINVVNLVDMWIIIIHQLICS
jgi:hypothetical protein